MITKEILPYPPTKFSTLDQSNIELRPLSTDQAKVESIEAKLQNTL